jgi:N-methylhydantoinase A
VSNRSYSIGLDIGGTFTDLVLLDDRGAIHVHKLLTTPSDPAVAALQGVEEILSTAASRLIRLTSSCTARPWSPALTEGRGARTGLHHARIP